MNMKLPSVDQVRECLILMVKASIAGWVRKQNKPFTVGDIYKDPDVGHDLIVHVEMAKAIIEALRRLHCEQVGDEFIPPQVRLIDRDLLVS